MEKDNKPPIQTEEMKEFTRQLVKEFIEEERKEKTAISLNEYNHFKNLLKEFKKIPDLKQEVGILERAIDNLIVYC